MARVQIILVLAVTLTLLSSTQGKPIFWFLPWRNWPYSSTSSSSGTSSTSSTASSSTPSNTSISIGDRTNTNAGLDDYGTSITGLTITTAGRRRRSAEQAQDISVPSNESYIQVGNNVIRIPSRNISNVSITIVDGVPYVEQGEIPTPPAFITGFFDNIRNFFGSFFNGTN